MCVSLVGFFPHVHAWCLKESEKGNRSSGTRVVSLFVDSGIFPGPLEET